VLEILKRIFSTEYMVPKNLVRGDITPSKEAYKTTVDMAVPAVAEMVSIAIISMIDMAMVGMIGAFAVAAIGLTTQPRMILMAIFIALNIGVTAIVSRRKGAGDQSEARLCLRTGIILSTALGIIISILAFVTADPFMALAGANEDTLAPAAEYFRILSISFFFSGLSTTICAAQRGIGNTRVTLMVNLPANIVKIIFNFLLIGGNLGFPAMGVAGAGWATVIASVVSFALALHSLTTKDTYLKTSIKDNWRPNLSMIKLISKIGGNSVVEQLALRIGFFLYARIVASLGTSAFAAHMIGMQLMQLSFTFADGIAAAATSLVGQNLGKNRPDLSMMYGKIGQRCALIVALVLGALSFSIRNVFPMIFTDEIYVIALASSVIIVLGFLQPLQTSQIVMAGTLRGTGDTRFVALTMLITVTFIRPFVGFAMVYWADLGLQGAWIAIAFDQIVRLILLTTRFSKGKWMTINV